jgi:hypothetical protein
MDTQPIGVHGLALNPKGDGKPHQDGSGQRRAAKQPSTRNTDNHDDPTDGHSLDAIAARLGAAFDHGRAAPEFYQIVA